MGHGDVGTVTVRRSAPSLMIYLFLLVIFASPSLLHAKSPPFPQVGTSSRYLNQISTPASIFCDTTTSTALRTKPYPASQTPDSSKTSPLLASPSLPQTSLRAPVSAPTHSQSSANVLTAPYANTFNRRVRLPHPQHPLADVLPILLFTVPAINDWTRTSNRQSSALTIRD